MHNYIENKKNNLKNNNGFTLVEMIVTFLVLGILLSISVMSLVAWQDWADFNRENEYAETLFLAAQNQLSEYSSNGTLSSFSTRAYDEVYGNKVNLNSIYYAEGKNYTAELNEENSVWVSKNAGTLCYAMSNKGDYKKYLAGETTESPTAPIVFELLDSYVYDTSILNETICIEFSLEDGQVFSAFYTDKSIRQEDSYYSAFEYNNSNESLRGLVNIATRYEAYRKDRMIGYYGVDTLSTALVSKNDKPTITKISLNNEETLNLSYKLGKYAVATNELTYNISVFDNETKKKVLDITLDTSAYPLKNYENRETVPCSVIRYNYDNAGNASSQELGKFDILAYIDKDNQVRVVLDAVDAQATTYLYNEDFSKLDNAASIKSGSVKFTKTLSFHRFGLSSEEIYCTVQGYSSKYKATSVKQSNVSDVYFANETAGVETDDSLGEVDHFNYTVKNARHLYNIRYIEDMKESDLAKYKNTDSGTAFCTFALIKDIDWEKFVEGDNYYSSNASNIKLPDGTYKTGNINIVTDRSFASFGKLRIYDKFIGNDYTVKGLKITESFNSLSGLYGYKNLNDIEKPVGLFNKNYGLIKTAKLDNIRVTSSSDKVGAFCGVNVAGVLANDEQTGILKNLTVLNSGINTENASSILGKEHVGGIVGYLQGVSEDEAEDNDFKDIVLSDLTNYAKVSGDKYVGGIIGEVRTSKTKAIKIIIDECTNKGAVLASNSEVDKNGIVTVKESTDPTKAKYIGGITGYTANVYANNHTGDNIQELITIRNCTSSPVYSDSDLNSLLDDSIDNAANVLSAKLNGVYVGGIVGYNYYSTIQSCTTKADKGKQGYVFGYRYVGGIVGFNQGPTSGIKGGNENINGINEANIVGCEYVGGITGCNADVDSEKLKKEALAKNYQPEGKYTNEILEATDVIVIPDTERNEDNKIENWVNKGVIFATGKYAGGISGYNSGWIFNCNSEVESTSVDGFFQSTYSSGDYTGGIAGYNNGVIGNTKREMSANGDFVISADNKQENDRRISAVCYISGKNYVGGIVGYNDVDAIVEDYELAGGYILGDEENSAFVGGYAGFNSSMRLLVDDNGNARTIVSKPNEVIGEYFVGGSVGGNIINTDITGNIPTVFKTDNFLGTIYGKAFVGGFVGYNMITDTDSLSYNDEEGLDVSYVIQKKIVDAFNTSDAGTSTDNQKLVEKADILNNIYNGSIGNLTASEAVMSISGTDNNTTKNSLGRIEADIYIGGVFGYNDGNTKVYVRDVENTTPIIADEAVEYNEQNGRNTDYAERSINYTYSYAGGIVGKVSRNMTIDNCSNASSGTVTTSGTYTGGISEINEGLIINCKANSFGSSVEDYVGGICGLNKLSGRIENCSASDITVSGRNVVSGIAAENFGEITGSNIDKLVLLVSGKDVIDEKTGAVTKDGTAAGIAAYNAGKIVLDKDIDITVSSKGNYAGAVAAVNDGNGTIVNSALPDNIDFSKDSYDDRIKIKGTIEGLYSVGGVIGKNDSDNSDIVIAGFTNNALVTATLGTAGGIVGDNASDNVIAYCDNYEVVTAANSGNAGGITSINSSTITKCNNYAEVKAASGMCGGISAINNDTGVISYCSVEPKDGAASLDFASKNAVGGISAINNGHIEYIKLNKVNVYNYTTSGASHIGVVTGINEEKGIIRFAAFTEDNKAIDSCTAKTYTDFSYVGGIAGSNLGKIEGDVLDSNSLPTTVIEAEVGFMPNSATVAIMGGVAGINYNRIANIGINGNIIGDLGGDAVGYGGIVGINGYLTSKDASDAGFDKYDASTYQAVIESCTFDGKVFAEGSGAGIARIGGIAGNNGYGADIRHCYIGVRNDGDGVSTDENGDVNQSRVTKIYAGKQENEDGTFTTDTKTEKRNYGVSAFGRNYGVDIITEAYDKQSYAYIGGIAGSNYGRVKECDNYAKSTEPVRIYSFTSISGGIVGYSLKDSIIEGTEDEHITTGEDWEIKARSTDNDRGNGGIVGTYSSSKDLKYLDNYADVSCIYKTNPCVGGIAGFIDQRDVTDLSISDSTNHGYVLSYNRAGGMIGLLAYSGIRFEDCINYGEVRSLHTSASGFIQYAMHIPTDIVFVGCFNHGNVVTYNTRGTGYISEFGGLNGAALRFIDCVNTGVIGRLSDKDTRIRYADGSNDSEDTAGVTDAGNELSDSAGFSFQGGSYTNCRNYANGKIFMLSYNGINAKDCFDASGSEVLSRNNTNVLFEFVPFANTYGNKNNTRNNYYITKDMDDTSIKQYGVYASIASGNLIREEYTNTVKSLYEPPAISNRFIYQGNRTTNISFDFKYDENSNGIDSLVVYFSDYNDNSSNFRYYKYECTLYDSDGNELTTITNGDEYVEVKNCNILDDGLTKISFGDYAGKTVAKAVLHTTFTNKDGGDIQASRFFGFGYVPVDNTEAISYFKSANKYYGEKTNTYMDFSYSDVPYNPDNSNTKVLYDNYEAYLWDYTAFSSATDTSRWSKNLPVNTFEKCTFDITYGENSEGLDKLYFITDTQNGRPTDKKDPYAYYAVFTDENGNKYYDGTEEEPNTITAAEQSQFHLVGVEVPAECTSKVVTAELYFRCIEKGRTWINISGFRWKEKNNDEIMLIPYDNSSGYFMTFLSSVYTKLSKEDGTDGSIKIYPSFVADEKTDEYSIVLENNDPWAGIYFNDKTPYDDACDLPDGTWDYNTRVGVFKELDPKYEEFLYSKTYNPDIKLDITTRFWLDTNNSKGKYRIKWYPVINAVGYMTHYSLENENGDIIYTSEDIENVVTTDNELYQDYDFKKLYDKFLENGGTGNFKIHFYVKAESAYHKLHEGDADESKNDSDYVELVENGRLALPMPEYHLEFIEGNKAVVVIDNFDDFIDVPDYQDVMEIVVESGNIFDGATKITIDMSKERAYSEPFTVTNASVYGNYRMVAYAQPKTEEAKKIYINSMYSYLSGALMGSSQHYRKNANNNDIYVITTNFKGFYGNTNDAMTYNVELTANNLDVYTIADIVSYDEELGVDIAYDHGNIHTASKEGGANANFTVSLSGLPSDIVGREFEVRSYIYATQSHIMYVGHDVEDDITITSLDDIKAIVDPDYFNEEGIKASDTEEGPQSIYDEGTGRLKPGYVIYDNQDGTYDVYYSTSLALDDKSVAEGETKGLYNVNRMTYYPYDEKSNEASDGYGYYLAKDLRENRSINNTWKNLYNVASMQIEYMPYKHEIIGKWTSNGTKYANVRFFFEWQKLYEDETFGYTFTDDTNKYPTRANVDNTTATTYTYNLGIPYTGTEITEDEIQAFYDEHLTFVLKRRDQFIQPRPDIESSYTTGMDERGHASYTFTWDVNKADYKYDAASYSVMLIGKTIAGEEVALTTPQVTDGNSITFVDTEDNWNYNRYVLTVNRIGTVDENGRSVILPSSSSKEFKSKLKLSQLSQPSVSLHSSADASGHNKFNKSGLLYDVIWAPITGASEISDLGGYLITVSVEEPGNPDIITKPHYYYITDTNAIDLGDTIGLDLESLTSNGKVVDLSNDKTSSYDEDYINLRGRHKAIIDLSDFNGGDKLNITIKAIARTEAENYMDGDNSTAAKLELPIRLAVPDITNMTSNITEGSLSVSEINNDGIVLEYTDSNYTNESGKYNIAIAIYDEKGKLLQDEDDASKAGSAKQIEFSGDGNADDENYWNSDALLTLVTKSEDAKMTGSKLAQASYELKADGTFVPSDYAGKWMKVAIRATSENNISSWWTDEDPDDASVNYFWVQIPMVEIDSPALTVTDNEAAKYYYNPEDSSWGSTQYDSTLYNIEMNQRTMRFKTADYADGYLVKLTAEDGQIQYIYLIPDEGKTTYEVYGFNCKPQENISYVEYVNELSNAKYDNNTFDPYTVRYGSVAVGDTIDIPYTVLFDSERYITEASYGNIVLDAKIRIDDTENVSIILPDIVNKIIKFNDISNVEYDVEAESFNFTKQITVQALINSDNDYYYIPSDICSWLRDSELVKEGTIDNDLAIGEPVEDIKEVISVESEFAVDESLNKTDDNGEVTSRYYKTVLRSDSPMLYRILVLDNSDSTPSLVCEKYAMIDTKVENPSDSTDVYYQSELAVLSDYFDEQSKYTVVISAAKITDANSISEWSDEWYLVKSGIGSRVEELNMNELVVGNSPDSNTVNMLLNISIDFAKPEIATETDAYTDEEPDEADTIDDSVDDGDSDGKADTASESKTEEKTETTTESTTEASAERHTETATEEITEEVTETTTEENIETQTEITTESVTETMSEADTDGSTTENSASDNTMEEDTEAE